MLTVLALPSQLTAAVHVGLRQSATHSAYVKLNTAQNFNFLCNPIHRVISIIPAHAGMFSGDTLWLPINLCKLAPAADQEQLSQPTQVGSKADASPENHTLNLVHSAG